MPYGIFKTGAEGKPYCVYRVDAEGHKLEGRDPLGCHPSEDAAKAQIQAIGVATHSKSALWMPTIAIRSLCPGCANQLDALGVERINLFALKQMPAALREGLCRSLGPDEGFFTRCMAKGFGDFEPEDKESFCAWLHRECTGKWPAEKTSTTSFGS